MENLLQSWFPGGSALTWADYSVLLVLLAALFAVGFWMGRGEQTTSDFFLGRRRIPVWAACLSFLATEISAMTIIGVPATAFRENWQYLQFVAGSGAARIVIAFLFIPAFYRYDCTSIYEFLRHRFGPGTQYCATLFFFVTRLLASGVRLMAACVAVAVLLGWGLVPVIALFTIISVSYIGFGGIRAVVWTNVLQATTFIISGVATLVFLLHSIDHGIGGILSVAGTAGRLDVWNWGPRIGAGYFHKFISDPNIIWVALFNGFFSSMASFGTDQELMQRLLTVETRAQSQRTLLYTIFAATGVVALYLAIGSALFTFYAQHSEFGLPAELDKVYPHFTVQVMPAFLRGLVLSAIFMASIDSPLASLSASFVTDLYRPLIRKDAREEHYLFVSRVAILVSGLILGWLAYYFSAYDKMLWLAFKIGGVTYGSLLGVFLLGLTTKTVANRSNVAAMTITAAANFGLLVLSEKGVLPIGWSWLVILGTLGTMGLARLLSPILDPQQTSAT